MKIDWQLIATAPKDGRRFLAFARGSSGGPLDVYYGLAQWAMADADLGAVQGWFWEFAIRPTHWAELPEPPAL